MATYIQYLHYREIQFLQTTEFAAPQSVIRLASEI